MCGVPPDFAEFRGMGWGGAELELLIASELRRIVSAVAQPNSNSLAERATRQR